MSAGQARRFTGVGLKSISAAASEKNPVWITVGGTNTIGEAWETG